MACQTVCKQGRDDVIVKVNLQSLIPASFSHQFATVIMAYGSTPYVGMTLKKNGGHNKSARMTHSKCLR